MKIGFTGTKNGMTHKQELTVISILEKFVDKYCPTSDRICEGHHGQCVGSDYTFGENAHHLGFTIILHPPINKSFTADCIYDMKRPPRPYLVRNHDIVDETSILIATPKEINEQLRSGTWATIRYARKLKRPILIVYPDGNVSREN